MKKIWLMLAMICSVCAFTACSDDDNKGDGETTPICPVTNVSLDKSSAKVGDQVVLSGKGFATGAKLYLKKTDEIQISGIAITSDGTTVTFYVPEVEEGVYNLVLEQNGKWTLTPTLTVEKKEVIKKITSLKINLIPAINFILNYDEEGKLTSVTQTEESKNPYKYFEISYGQDSIYITMDSRGGYPKSQGHLVYKGNQVTSCNGNAWSFGEDGYLKSAVTGTMIPTTYTYGYEAGNLMTWKTEYMGQAAEYGFKYEGSCPAVKAIDIAAFSALIVSGNVGSVLSVAHLLNICGNPSALLPSAIIGTKTDISFDENDNMITTETEVTSTIKSSDFDADGYITNVVIDEQIKFNKDLIIDLTWE